MIHPEKSTIIMRIPKKSTRFEVTDWKLGDKEVSISQTTTHLGILPLNFSQKAKVKSF
jgi:hypothetical protein